MLKRPVNVGFSGGEKKRAEMVQMGIMNPKFAVLDETDSGLDIDALKAVGAGINRIMRAPDKGVLLITHYQRLLDYVEPDHVHVLRGRPDRAQRRSRARARARARRLCGGGSMTAPFPTHKQEEWRYADLDALKPVWEQFAEPVTLTVGAGESLEEIWLPTADDVQLRRVQLALGRRREGAHLRAQHCTGLRPHRA